MRRADKAGEEWPGRGGDYYSLWLGGPFRFGQEHFWYDGPHCSWSFGFVHVGWSCDWHCKKCEAER